MAIVLTFNAGFKGIPPMVMDRLPKGRIPLTWSYHALEKAEALNFKLADETIDLSRVRIVEVETNAAHVPTKVICRFAEDNRRDKVMAIALEDGEGTVVTCWANQNSDHHTTLKMKRQALVCA